MSQQDPLSEAREKWEESINIHYTAIGSLTGFSVAAIAGFFAIDSVITTVEKITISVAVGTLFLQTYFWFTLIKRNRKIKWHQLESVGWFTVRQNLDMSENSVKAALELSRGNNWMEQTLNGLVVCSVFLVLLLFVLEAWAPGSLLTEVQPTSSYTQD